MEDTKLDRKDVKSSNIKSIAYDETSQVLEIEFLPRQEGSTETSKARYDKVPANVWEDLQKAESVGKFYHNNIKGKYPNTGPQNN